MPDQTELETSRLPEPVATPKKRWRVQVIWLIPLVAALIGAWLAINAILQRGPTVTISFKTAEGLEAGKTKLKYKDVEIGVVKNVTLSPDLTHVLAEAELVKDFTPHLVDDTRFWIVRPRISGGTVSGLSTLLSGSYVGVDAGRSARSARHYTGLETPPVVKLDTPGQEYTLHSDTMGAFDAGVPLFFRQLPVGQVVGYEIDPSGRGVLIKVFVNAPFTRFVNVPARFPRSDCRRRCRRSRPRPAIASREFISAGMDLHRALRDAAMENLFFSIYANLFSVYIAEKHVAEARKTPAEARELPFVKDMLAAVDQGGYDEAFARVAYMLSRRGEPLPIARLRMHEELVRAYADFLPRMPLEQWRRVRGEQEIIARYAPDQALATLPRLLAEPEDRRRLLTLLDRLMGDERVLREKPSDEQLSMLGDIRRVLAERPSMPAPPPPGARPARHRARASGH